MSKPTWATKEVRGHLEAIAKASNALAHIFAEQPGDCNGPVSLAYEVAALARAIAGRPLQDEEPLVLAYMLMERAQDLHAIAEEDVMESRADAHRAGVPS